MKHLIVPLTLSFLIACASEEPRTQAPAPEPTTRGQSQIGRKPPECASCNADMRRRIADCGAANSSCASRCMGDAMQRAMCQSQCASLHSTCAAYASTPTDCPAYCAL